MLKLTQQFYGRKPEQQSPKEVEIIFTSNIGAFVDISLGDGTFLRQSNILPYS